MVSILQKLMMSNETKLIMSLCPDMASELIAILYGQIVNPSTLGIYECHYHRYRQTSNISRTTVGNEIVDHSDVVGALPVCAAPTISHSRFNTWLQWIERRQLQCDKRNI